jgi:hypothetical protein
MPAFDCVGDGQTPLRVDALRHRDKYFDITSTFGLSLE